MTTHSIMLADFLVWCLTLFAVIWYACETNRIKKAATEQVEALHKPCLVLKSTARQGDEAIIATGGIEGGMILAFNEGMVVVTNIGTGPALNVTYSFHQVDSSPEENARIAEGYLQNIACGLEFAMPISRTTLSAHKYEFTAHYRSLSGRRYETRLTIHNLVLTEPMNFQQ